MGQTGTHRGGIGGKLNMPFRFQISDFRLAGGAGGFAIALLAWLAVGCDRDKAASSTQSAGGLGTQALAFPEHGIYTGAYIDWGDKEDAVTLEKIEGFEQLVGKKQAIIASSSY